MVELLHFDGVLQKKGGGGYVNVQICYENGYILILQTRPLYIQILAPPCNEAIQQARI
jgi:hypothetical protein